jgi:hypothetical protein
MQVGLPASKTPKTLGRLPQTDNHARWVKATNLVQGFKRVGENEVAVYAVLVRLCWD